MRVAVAHERVTGATCPPSTPSPRRPTGPDRACSGSRRASTHGGASRHRPPLECIVPHRPTQSAAGQRDRGRRDRASPHARWPPPTGGRRQPRISTSWTRMVEPAPSTGVAVRRKPTGLRSASGWDAVGPHARRRRHIPGLASPSAARSVHSSSRSRCRSPTPSRWRPIRAVPSSDVPVRRSIERAGVVGRPARRGAAEHRWGPLVRFGRNAPPAPGLTGAGGNTTGSEPRFVGSEPLPRVAVDALEPPSHPPGARYSTRIATIGSTRSACRVGTTQASRHTPSMNAA